MDYEKKSQRVIVLATQKHKKNEQFLVSELFEPGEAIFKDENHIPFIKKLVVLIIESWLSSSLLKERDFLAIITFFDLYIKYFAHIFMNFPISQVNPGRKTISIKSIFSGLW